jgi:hypothetical protein
MSVSARSDLVLLQQLYRYWTELRGVRLMPSRGEIDLVHLRGLLPKLMIIDVVGSAERPQFRYAMLGTDLLARLGRDVTGKCADEVLEGHHRKFMLDLYSEPVRTKGPAMAASEYISKNEVAFTCQRLVLPLSADGVTVTQLLGMQIFLPGAPGTTKLEFRDNTIRDVRLQVA